MVNTRSRLGRQSFDMALEALAARHVPLAGCHRVSRPRRLQAVLHEAVEAGVRRFLVGGGDGTLSCAVPELLGHEATLGVLPLGTGNDFARSLGIPPTLEAACDVIAAGYSTWVDVGLANGHPFLNAASLGLTVGVARRLTPRLKRRAGKLAYPLAAAAEAWEQQPFHVRLVSDGGRLEAEALQVVVGNGRFHGAGSVVAPEATLDDHWLDVYVISSLAAGAGLEGNGLARLRDMATLARVGLAVRRGDHVEHPAVLSLRAKRLHVDAVPTQELQADGEPAGRTPVLFELLPAALRVHVPAHA